MTHVTRPRSPLLDDGLDNFPPPLSANSDDLAREVRAEPEIIDQMAVDDVGPPPDGGLQAWSCVAGAWCILFCIFGFNTSFGQLQVYYLSHQLKDYSEAEIGWISSIAVFLVSAGGIFSGRYFDSHGARTLLWTGSTVCVGSMIGIASSGACDGKELIAVSTQYWHFLLSHAGVGLAGTLLYAPATAVAGHWFVKRRSTAVGVVNSGSGLAGVILPIMIKELIEALGFRHGMLIVAGLVAALMLFACRTMKARLPPRRSPPWKALARPWNEPRYSCLVIGASLAMMNWVSPYFNAPVYAHTNNANPTIQGYAVAFLQAGSFIGRISSGFLADRFGVWTTFVAMGVACSAVLYGLWTPTTLPGGAVVFGLVAYGVVSGAWISLIASSCAAISPMREVGMRIGMLFTLSGPPSLAGPVICGALIGAKNGQFTWAAIFSGSTILVGVLTTVGPVPMRWIADSTMKKQRIKAAEVAEAERGRPSVFRMETFDDKE